MVQTSSITMQSLLGLELCPHQGHKRLMFFWFLSVMLRVCECDFGIKAFELRNNLILLDREGL